MATDEAGDKVSKTWKSGAQLAIIGLVFALSWGYTQSQKAGQLEEQLQAARMQLTELSKRDLPVSVSFRQALLGSGLVAIFKNNSGSPLEVAGEFSSQATGDTKRVALVIPARSEQQIGHAEGWAFVAGQHIKLANTQFRTIEYTVPSL